MNTSHWRTAGPCHANNTCVEVGRCEEAGRREQRVVIRDTKARDRGVVTMSRSSFGKLLNDLRG